MIIKLNWKERIGWILLIIRGGDINPGKICLYIPSFSTNKVSTNKDICTVILSIRTQRLCSKVKSNKISRRSMPLYITQYSLGYLFLCMILALSSRCMIFHCREDTGIHFPWGITSSIHGLQTRGYKVVCYHRIRFLRLNLICYLFLMFIFKPGLEHGNNS